MMKLSITEPGVLVSGKKSAAPKPAEGTRPTIVFLPNDATSAALRKVVLTKETLQDGKRQIINV
jgi:hypothetical protein